MAHLELRFVLGRKWQYLSPQTRFKNSEMFKKNFARAGVVVPGISLTKLVRFNSTAFRIRLQ
jgi:hypothetical protein